MFKKLTCIFILILILTSVFCGVASAEPAKFDDAVVTSDTAILMDANSGKVLYSKGLDDKIYPASLTKVLTALVVLENAKLTDTVTCTSSVTSLPKDSSLVHLYKGEKITVKDLLHGLLLVSGNDAAVALAQHVSGNISDFAGLMNKKAEEIGMTNSHFRNPHGLHNEEHYTTIHDLALLCQQATKNETLMKIVGTEKYTIAPTNKSAQQRKLVTTNRLMCVNRNPDVDKNYLYEYAVGMKTGSTNKAGACFMGVAKKDDMTLIGIACGDRSSNGSKRWGIVRSMFEYGFDSYTTLNVNELIKNEKFEITVENANNATIQLKPEIEANTFVTIEKAAADAKLSSENTLPEQLQAPLKKGETVGTVTFNYGGNELCTANLSVTEEIKEGATIGDEQSPNDANPPVSTVAPIDPGAKKTLDSSWWWWLFIPLTLICFIIIRAVAMNPRRRRRRYNNANRYKGKRRKRY